jgi:hypothetical protein
MADGADSQLLDRPIRFTHINQIELASNEDNLLNLKKLSTNYPGLRRLGLRQREKAANDLVALLSTFPQLDDLAIDCPVSEPRALPGFLPKSLTQLYLGPTSNVAESAAARLELPTLKNIDIRGCTMSSAFLANCRVPKLQQISLVNVMFDRGSLLALTRFPKFKLLDIYYSKKLFEPMSKIVNAEVSDLRQRGIRVTLIVGT